MIPILKKNINKEIISEALRFESGWWIIILPLVLTALSREHVLFWDTAQFAGKHPQWFYQNDFQYLLLPEAIDSGHPPVFGWYLALLWKLFGKNLAVNHWAMFPFLIGIVWQLVRWSRLWLRSLSPIWLLLLVWCDPVFLGQSVLVSPDIALVFFFLLALNSCWSGQRLMLALAFAGLVAISTRGMMVVAALGLYELLLHRQELKGGQFVLWRSLIAAYVPAALFSILYLWVHYRYTGWIGYHQDSPWAYGFGRVDLGGMLYNAGIFGWRWLDFGRVFLWVVVGIILLRRGFSISEVMRPPLLTSAPAKTSRREGSESGKIVVPYSLTALLVIITASLSISFLIYRGLHDHRYLLPAFLVFSMWSVVLVDQLVRPKLQRSLMLVMILGLATGNLWVYPERVSQGWDATLAHWPYYGLREKMLHYLAENEIPLQSVGTAFPDIGALDYRDLSGRENGFKEKDLTEDQYVLYSNVMNDFSDTEIDALYREWEKIAHFQSRGIFMTLYRRSSSK